jgi:hypothetical protein
VALPERAQDQDRAVGSGRPGGFRRLARLVAIAAFVAFVAGCGVSPTPSPSANPTGVLFIQPGATVQAAPPTEELKAVFFAMQQLADTNGADLGYAWFDVATGEIVLSAVTPRGRDLIDAAGITAPHRIRTVTHGFDELEHIKDDITFLGAQGVPDAQLLYMTAPDWQDNRTLVGMKSLSQPLLDALLARYPADALAIQVDPAGLH